MENLQESIFQDLEAIGRAPVIAWLLAQPGITGVHPTTDPFDPIDILADSHAGTVALEVKARSAVYSSGQILETAKLLALLDTLSSGRACWAYYVNVLPGALYFWRITQDTLALPEYTKYLPATTARPGQSRQKSYRLLPLSQAVRVSIP